MNKNKEYRVDFQRNETEYKKINWNRIARAVDFFTSKGFEYVEVPWIVDDKFVKFTYPKENPTKHAFQTSLGTLVGSAEQSFISLMHEQKIHDSCICVAVTPCFRDHQPNDQIHQNYFMKVELFSRNRAWGANKLMTSAGEFFAKEGAIIKSQKTNVGFDWEVSGIEIGSYGNRNIIPNNTNFDKNQNYFWSYGTGLAEPRFSQALSKQKNLHNNPPFDELKNHVEQL